LDFRKINATIGSSGIDIIYDFTKQNVQYQPVAPRCSPMCGVKITLGMPHNSDTKAHRCFWLFGKTSTAAPFFFPFFKLASKALMSTTWPLERFKRLLHPSCFRRFGHQLYFHYSFYRLHVTNHMTKKVILSRGTFLAFPKANLSTT
jgi:hypothetical protein